MTDADRHDALRRAEAFGVDLSLLRESLRLTPAERLDRHQRALALIAEMRNAMPPPSASVPPRPLR